MALGAGDGAGHWLATRLAAAQVALSKAFLPFLTDQQLLYEVKRRTAALRHRSEADRLT